MTTRDTSGGTTWCKSWRSQEVLVSRRYIVGYSMGTAFSMGYTHEIQQGVQHEAQHLGEGALTSSKQSPKTARDS